LRKKGAAQKFGSSVQQITFSGKVAAKADKEVVYVTDRQSRYAQGPSPFFRSGRPRPVILVSVSPPGDAWACAEVTAEEACIRQGMRDYREGRCYWARPYSDGSPEQALWRRGYFAQQRREHNTRDWSHCHPSVEKH
jgi:hypothetical protein